VPGAHMHIRARARIIATSPEVKIATQLPGNSRFATEIC
jgi:hypothetical protein